MVAADLAGGWNSGLVSLRTEHSGLALEKQVALECIRGWTGTWATKSNCSP